MAEIEVDLGQVAELVSAQHPDLAGPLEAVESGWDNWMFRLGTELAVRLPRRRLAVELIEHERRWLPRLADRLPAAIPTPVRAGAPSLQFAWPWNIVRWIPGEIAERRPLETSGGEQLARFLAALHRPAPADAPRNDFRGVPLASRRAAIEARIDALGNWAPEIDADAVTRCWRAALAAPIDVDGRWVHGDPHPRNVVVDERGGLAGVVDWGDLCVGDPATDLSAVWMHLGLEHHEQFWSAYGPVTTATRRRAAGWAVFYGTILIEAGRGGDEGFAAIGRRILERLVARGDQV